MRKSGKVALGVLAILFAIGVPGWAAANVIQGQRADETYDQSAEEGKARANDTVWHMGETMRLSVDEGVAETTGDSYYANELPWTGTLEVTVKNAAVYDSPASIGIDNEKTGFCAESDDTSHSDAAFILCEIVIANVDAAPLFPTSGGEEWFNVTFLNLSPYFPFCYFDGTPEDATEHDGWCFDLSQGEEKTFRLGYFCPNDAQSLAALEQALQDQSLMLCAGMSSDAGNGKYCCQLEIEDKRSSK